MAAIILAAGASARMGSPKGLLTDRDGRPFVVRLAATFRAAGVTDLVIVTGAHHDALAEAVRGDADSRDARVARNADPSRGQLSSLWVGLDALDDLHPDAVLMTLVDVPFARPATVRAVVDAWRRTQAPIVRPAMGERHGHPVLFDRAMIAELRRAPLEEGAKVVVHSHAEELVNVPVDDEGAVTDIDTPADYEDLVRRLG